MLPYIDSTSFFFVGILYCKEYRCIKKKLNQFSSAGLYLIAYIFCYLKKPCKNKCPCICIILCTSVRISGDKVFNWWYV